MWRVFSVNARRPVQQSPVRGRHHGSGARRCGTIDGVRAVLVRAIRSPANLCTARRKARLRQPGKQRRMHESHGSRCCSSRTVSSSVFPYSAGSRFIPSPYIARAESRRVAAITGRSRLPRVKNVTHLRLGRPPLAEIRHASKLSAVKDSTMTEERWHAQP